MKLIRKTLLSALCVAAALLLILAMGVDPAQGDANYRNSERPQQALVSHTLDLMTLNVAHGRGTALNQLMVSTGQHRRNLDEIASILLASGAQIAALQEADAPSLWSGRFDHVAYLAEATTYPYLVHGYHATAWPFTYGAALISRFQMSDTDSHRFSPTWPTATKGYVRGTILWRSPENDAAARPVTLVSVHLDFSREEVRRAQVAEMIDTLKELSTPLIIMGDFNADWSTTDSPVRLLANALRLRAFKPTAQELGTYKDVNRLDWILISDDLSFSEYTVLPEVVSDHLAVVAKISWKSKD